MQQQYLLIKQEAARESKRQKIHSCFSLALLLKDILLCSFIPTFALPCAGTSICSALWWARPGELIQAETNLAKMNYSTGAGMHSQGNGKGKISSLSSSPSGGHAIPVSADAIT